MTIKPLPFREIPGEPLAERSLRWMLFNPETLDEMTQNLYMSESELSPGDSSREFKLLSEKEKETWRNSTIERMRKFADMTPAEQRFHNRVSMGKQLKKNDERFKKLIEEDK
jgi:hypothetical protein